MDTFYKSQCLNIVYYIIFFVHFFRDTYDREMKMKQQKSSTSNSMNKSRKPAMPVYTPPFRSTKTGIWHSIKQLAEFHVTIFSFAIYMLYMVMVFKVSNLNFYSGSMKTLLALGDNKIELKRFI